MSARQPFFPKPTARPATRTEPGSGPLTFAADLTNPLHGGASDKASVQPSPAVEGRPATSGLGGFKKRKSNPDAAAHPIPDGFFRPGTADPHASKALHALSQFDQQQGIVQPIPQRAARPASTLFFAKSRNSLNGNALDEPDSVSATDFAAVIPSVAASTPQSLEKSAHITTSVSDASSTNSAVPNELLSANSHTACDDVAKQAPVLNIKFNPSANQFAPRRVFVAPGSAHFQDDQHGSSAHEVTEDGRVRWTTLDRKRTIDQVDEDDDNYGYENRPKRMKSIAEKMVDQGRGFSGEISPIQDRPSSSLSQSTDRRSANPQIRSSPVPHRQIRPQSRQMSSGPEYAPYEIENAHQQRRQSISALDGLLGQDSDAVVREYLNVYDQLVQKWSNCTMEEWVSGSDDIVAQYCKILDYVKDYVTGKVKLLGDLHKDIDKHDAILSERSRDLSAAKTKLVQESGNFLGK